MSDLPPPVVVTYEQFLEYRNRRVTKREALRQDPAVAPSGVEPPQQPPVLESAARLPRP